MNMERRTIKRFKNSQSNHSIFQKVSPHRAREFCKSEAECEKEGDPEVVRCDGGRLPRRLSWIGPQSNQ